LSVIDSSEGSAGYINEIKENQIDRLSPNVNPNLPVTVGKLDDASTSSHSEEEEEEEEEDTKDAIKQSDASIGEEDGSTDEQKNKDESSVMVENGSFSPTENDAIDKDNEEVNEPVTQIEMETSVEAGDDTKNVESE